MNSVISIGTGAFLGALLRWLMGIQLNHLFPSLPLGTLLVNLIGGLLMGSMIFFTTEHTFFSYEARLGVITGFLGSFTTFSTFSGEAMMLFSRQEYFLFSALIFLHVFGSVCMVAAGYALTKLIFTFFFLGGQE